MPAPERGARCPRWTGLLVVPASSGKPAVHVEVVELVVRLSGADTVEDLAHDGGGQAAVVALARQHAHEPAVCRRAVEPTHGPGAPLHQSSGRGSLVLVVDL